MSTAQPSLITVLYLFSGSESVCMELAHTAVTTLWNSDNSVVGLVYKHLIVGSGTNIEWDHDLSDAADFRSDLV